MWAPWVSVDRCLLHRAGFFPGAVYICTCWYMPADVATRVSVFYCVSSLSGAFSGLLAAAISQMNGLGGYAGWRWIFLIEGLATVVLALLCFVVLIDTPALSSRWLDKEEIRFLELQTVIKQGGHSEYRIPSQKRELKNVVRDWRMYVLSSFVIINSATSYGEYRLFSHKQILGAPSNSRRCRAMANFKSHLGTKVTLPTITKSMGYTTTKAQLMSAPPYLAGAVATLLAGRLSDRLKWRMPFIAVPCTLILIGYAVIVSLHGELASHIAATYVGIVIALTGIYPIQPATQAWNANNLAPAGRRAVGVGMLSTIGNLGSILGSFMYLESEAPRYPTGFGISLALGAAGLVCSLVLELSFKRDNDRRARMSEEEVRAMYSEEELLAMGNKSPLFRYVL